MRRTISPTSIGLKPGFLSSGINLQASKGSKLQFETFSKKIFSLTFAITLHKSVGEIVY